MRDNQPKHRQLGKEQRKLARRKASRTGFPAILIVCEGRETEPNYIRGLCEASYVNLAAVKICLGTHVTDAASLVKRARQIFESDPDFDQVFVVCDNDGGSLDQATKLAQEPLYRMDGEQLTIAIVSTTPCFEFWLLLHFQYSARPYRNSAEVIADLRAHLPDYAKADTRIFAKVAAGLDRAIGHAQKLKRELKRAGAKQPDTDMAKLVEQLLSMRRSPAA